MRKQVTALLVVGMVLTSVSLYSPGEASEAGVYETKPPWLELELIRDYGLAETRVENLIIKLKDTGLFDKAQFFVDLFWLESKWKPKAYNKKSQASGLAQILPSTWRNYGCEGDPFREEDNIDCAIKLYLEDGIRPWCADIAMYHALRDLGYYCSPSWVDERSL